MKGRLLAVVAGLSCCCVARGVDVRLKGDGIHDDTAAIQAMLDGGERLVELPIPKTEYLISRTLFINDGQELRLGKRTRIRLADGSNCSMLENRDWKAGNRNIVVTGGVWDMNNLGQRHNLGALFWMKPEKRRMWLNESRERVQRARHQYDDVEGFVHERFFGSCFRLFNITGLKLKDVTIRNPTTFGIQMWKVSDFAIDGITFDYVWGNPGKANMDGIHLDGCCTHGRISNIRGCCFDDAVALNATDGIESPGFGPITDIEIDGIFFDYCHSAVRMLSRSPHDPIRRVSICNVTGRYYSYGIGLTYFLPEIKERGVIDEIVISDCRLSKAGEPADCWQFAPSALVEIEKGLDIGSVRIERLVRDEDQRSDVDTVRLKEGATVGRLVLKDCEQINRTAGLMTFLHNAGTIGELVTTGTKLVSSPGKNIEYDDRTPTIQWDPPWATLDDIKSLDVACGYPSRGAMRPAGKIRAGFGPDMIRVYPFVGDVANAKMARIDDYSAAGYPGYFVVELPDESIRTEVTTSASNAWFRIRYPEYKVRKLIVPRNFKVAVSESFLRTEEHGENEVYTFAPGWSPIVVKLSADGLFDDGFDFDRTMDDSRRAWNGCLPR